MTRSLVRTATRKWLSIVTEARSAGSPTVVGWRMPHLGCGLQLSARGPELLRDSATRHGSTFSLYLGGRLITVCQERSVMQAIYGGDDALAPIEDGDLAGMKGGRASERLHRNRRSEPLEELLRRHGDALPIVLSGALARHAQLAEAGRFDLVPTLRSWMDAMSRELLWSRQHPAYDELSITTHIMAAVAALCLIHIKDEPELMSRVREALDRSNGEPPEDTPLLNACLDEALRLYGPTLHFRKTCRALRAGRYILPAGRVVAFSPFLLHRSPEVYTEPHAFKPDRFIDGPQLPGGPPKPWQFMPFERRDLSWQLVRTQALLCLNHLLKDRAIFVTCVGEPTRVSWSLTGATPSDQRWLHYVPRLPEEELEQELPEQGPPEPEREPPEQAQLEASIEAPRQSGISNTVVNLRQAATEAARRFAVA